ncbi:MAG: hypothetical protein IJ730_01875 [Alphaproteobacteria bacterium]|nr:hypothetical protein [Alphaproteobacteria bacterium]
MQNPLFQALVKMAGLPKIPQTPQELYNMVANNPQFQKDFKAAEQAGILKRDSQGNLNVLDQNKLNSVVQGFLMNMFKGK